MKMNTTESQQNARHRKDAAEAEPMAMTRDGRIACRVAEYAALDGLLDGWEP